MGSRQIFGINSFILTAIVWCQKVAHHYIHHNKRLDMTQIEMDTLATLKRAANAYLDHIGEDMKMSRERLAIEQQMRNITVEMAARQQPVPDELIWANRRYDIAKHCLGILAIGTVPDIMGKREITPAKAVRSAIELADELIKQLKRGDKR